MPKLENGFGRAPDAFNAFVEDTLSRRMEEEQMKLRHKSIGGVWVLALVLLLLMGTALAVTGGFGVLDFKKPESPETLLQNVHDLTNNEALESPLVRYQIQDALIDGGRLLFTIACESTDPDRYMLMPTDDPSTWDPITEKTYAQLVAETGKEMVYVAFPDVTVNGELHMTTGDNFTQDGTLYWLLEPAATLLPGANEVVCKLHDSPLYGAEYIKETDESLGVEGYHIPDFGEGTDTTLVFSIESADKAAAVETVRFTGPFESEYATVDWVEYTRGNLSTGLRVQFTVHENLTKAEQEALTFLSFWLMNSPDDENGVGMSGTTARVDGKTDYDNIAGVTFLQDWTYDAVNTMPDAIYLRPRQMGFTFGDLITLPMSEGEIIEKPI